MVRYAIISRDAQLKLAQVSFYNIKNIRYIGDIEVPSKYGLAAGAINGRNRSIIYDAFTHPTKLSEEDLTAIELFGTVCNSVDEYYDNFMGD